MRSVYTGWGRIGISGESSHKPVVMFKHESEPSKPVQKMFTPSGAASIDKILKIVYNILESKETKKV